MLGVDLAVAPTGLLHRPAPAGHRPVRAPRPQAPGGAATPVPRRRVSVDPRLPRVTVPRPGQAAAAGLGGAVPAGHRRPTSPASAATPVATLDLVAEHAPTRRTGDRSWSSCSAPPPSSAGPLAAPPARPGPGGAATAGATLVASDRPASSRWSRHRRPDGARPASAHAARMLGLGRRRAGLPRGAHQRGALRRPRPTPRPSTCSTPPAGWSPLDPRHVDRGNAEGYLKSGKEMAEVAEEVCRRRPGSATTGREARRLLAAHPARSPTGARSTRAPTSGIGRGALPGVRRSLGRAGRRRRAAGDGAAGAVRGRRSAGATAGAPRPARSGSGSTTSSRSSRGLGYAVLLPHRRRRHRPDPRHGGPGRGARVGRRQPGQLPARHLRGRPDRATAC